MKAPIKFMAQYMDGVLEMEGVPFEWEGMVFVTHHTRPLYRFDDNLSVSHADTGFGMTGVIPIVTKSHDRMRRAAVDRLKAIGPDKVRAAIAKAAARTKPSKVLSA